MILSDLKNNWKINYNLFKKREIKKRGAERNHPLKVGQLSLPILTVFVSINDLSQKCLL